MKIGSFWFVCYKRKVTCAEEKCKVHRSERTSRSQGGVQEVQRKQEERVQTWKFSSVSEIDTHSSFTSFLISRRREEA